MTNVPTIGHRRRISTVALTDTPRNSGLGSRKKSHTSGLSSLKEEPRSGNDTPAKNAEDEEARREAQ